MFLYENDEIIHNHVKDLPFQHSHSWHEPNKVSKGRFFSERKNANARKIEKEKEKGFVGGFCIKEKDLFDTGEIELKAIVNPRQNLIPPNEVRAVHHSYVRRHFRPNSQWPNSILTLQLTILQPEIAYKWELTKKMKIEVKCQIQGF